MSPLGFRALVVGCVVVLGARESAWAAPVERYGDLAITATSTRSEAWRHGYNEHRFAVHNRSSTLTHRLTLELPSNAYGNYGLYRMRRSADIPPGATVELAIPQPPLQLGGPNNAAVIIDGTRQQDTLPVASLGTSPDHGGRQRASLLASRSLATDGLRLQFDALFGTNTTGHGSSSNPGIDITRAEAETVQWSPSWLSYTRFDAVLLPAAEWRALPSAVREAIERYVAAGGTLVLLGSERTENPQPSFFPRAAGSIACIGLGRVLRIADASAWTREDARELADCMTDATARWCDVRDTRQGQFPVVDGVGIPVRGTFLLLAVFALLTGPITVVLLARRNHRIWLYWIAPSVSLITCVIVFAHALLSEGVRPRVRTEAVTLLDQESRLAVSLATTGFYCPMTPTGGLVFEADTEVTPLLDQNQNGRRTIDWTTGQHFDNGWVLSRVPATFVLRSATPRNERLDVSQSAAGEVTVVNGLGAPIQRLRLADATGRLHTAAAIPAGARATLVAESGTRSETAQAPASLASELFFSTGARYGISNLVQAATLPAPPPDHYVAVVLGAPFVDNALPGKAHRAETSVVLGRVAVDPERR